MKNKLRIIAIIVAVIIVIAIALPLLVNVNTFRPRLEAELTNALGRQVTMGNLSLSIFSGAVAADDISIADDPAFSNLPFIRAKSLKVGVQLMPLIFSKTLNITDLTLDQPDITLLRSPAGTWNYSSLGGNNAHKTATATAPPANTSPASKPAPSAKPEPASSSSG